MKFDMKRYEKDRKKCYENSKKGINLESIINTEDRILSRSIQNNIRNIHGVSTETMKLMEEVEKCGKRDLLGLCTLHLKDRIEDKCQYCEINV